MAKRFGSVIVFKKGVTKAQAAKALATLAAVVDFPEKVYEYPRVGPRQVKQVEVPFTHEHAIHDFDDEHGGPVWYIP